jgi:hypothetical protein
MPCALKDYIRSLAAMLLLAAAAMPANAQKEKESRITLRATCTVPHPVANGAFRKSLTGIYDASFTVTARPFSTLHAGLIYKNGLMKTAANKIAEVNTSLQLNSVGGRVGYDHYLSEIVFFAPAVNAGRTYGKFTGVVCLNPQEVNKHFSAMFIEPEVNMFFIVDPNFAIGVNLSATYIDHTFDPYSVCFNQYKGYTSAELRGSSLMVNLGFGFYYGLWGGAPRNQD